MSEARNKYYEYAKDGWLNIPRYIAQDYVAELEYRLENACERRRLCPGLNAYIPIEDCEGCDSMSEECGEILQCSERTKITKLESKNQKLIEDLTDIGIEKIRLEKEKAELIESENHYKKCYLSELADKSELIEAIKEIQELTVKGIPFKNMRHYIQKQCLRMIKKHGVEI